MYSGPERRDGMVDPVAFGTLKNQVETLHDEVTDVRRDVKELLALANRGRGAIWFGMALSGGFGAAISWAVSIFTAHPGKGG